MLADLGLGEPFGTPPMSTNTMFSDTAQIVNAANNLHSAYLKRKQTPGRMFVVLTPRGVEAPPFGWSNRYMIGNRNVPVVDIGGSGMDGVVGTTSKKGQYLKKEADMPLNSNQMYVKFMKNEMTEKDLADFQLDGVKSLVKGLDVKQADKKHYKIRLYQTGKMRSEWFKWCEKHSTCNSARAEMLFNRLYQGYDGYDRDYADYEAYGQEYDGYESFDGAYGQGIVYLSM